MHVKSNYICGEFFILKTNRDIESVMNDQNVWEDLPQAIFFSYRTCQTTKKQKVLYYQNWITNMKEVWCFNFKIPTCKWLVKTERVQVTSKQWQSQLWFPQVTSSTRVFLVNNPLPLPLLPLPPLYDVLLLVVTNVTCISLRSKELFIHLTLACPWLILLGPV